MVDTSNYFHYTTQTSRNQTKLLHKNNSLFMPDHRLEVAGFRMTRMQPGEFGHN